MDGLNDVVAEVYKLIGDRISVNKDMWRSLGDI